MSLGLYLGAGSSITQGLYRLENVNDSSGNSRTLTNTGTVTFTQALFGNGANLGTSNSSKKLTVASNMGITGGNMTMSTWVKVLTDITPSSGTVYTFLLQSYATNNTGYAIQYFDNSGTRSLFFSRLKIGGPAQSVAYAITLGTTNWYNIIITYDSTNVIGYVNGESVASVAASGNGVSGASSLFSIGNHATASQWSSSIHDEVFIESRAWSAGEVKKYYTYSKGRFGII